MKRLLLIVAAVFLAAQAPAPTPDAPLTDPTQEARARALFSEIRCVVCQHESIADSPADLAADLRRLVREEIAAGATDQAVRETLVARYGDYVLFRPPFRLGTALLWLAPLLVVLGALAVLLFRRRAEEPKELSPDEERRLAEILADDDIGQDLDATLPQDRR